MAETYRRGPYWQRTSQPETREEDEARMDASRPAPQGAIAREFGGGGSPHNYGRQPFAAYSYGQGDYSRYGRAQGRAPKGYRRSDSRIREDVCERLMQSDLDVSDVSVEVRDGIVTLDGTVPVRPMKYAIEDIAERCLGVADIDNRLRAARQAGGARGMEPDTPV
jgi:hypothetical protein